MTPKRMSAVLTMMGTILRGVRLSKLFKAPFCLLFLLPGPTASAGERPRAVRPHPQRFSLKRGPRIRRIVPPVRTPKCAGFEKLPTRPIQPFRVGEELAYEITVGGAYVGRLEMKIGAPRKVSGRELLPLFARARTSAFVSALQPFEGRYMALVDPVTLAPTGARVEGTYAGDPRWERIRFAQDQRQVTSDYLVKGKELKRTYQGRHDLTDILTLLYAARRIELKQGLTGCQDVFGARRLWRMDAKVDGQVSMQTLAGKKRAYKVAAVFDRKPTRGLNNNKRPRFEVDLFMADDPTQAPLAFVMRQGGVTAEAKLVRWSLQANNTKKWELF